MVKKDFMFQVISFGVIITSWLILSTFKIRKGFGFWGFFFWSAGQILKILYDYK